MFTSMQVPLAHNDCLYSATLADDPSPLPTATVSVADGTRCMQYLLDTLDISPLSAAATFELYFEAVSYTHLTLPTILLV